MGKLAELSGSLVGVLLVRWWAPETMNSERLMDDRSVAQCLPEMLTLTGQSFRHMHHRRLILSST